MQAQHRSPYSKSSDHVIKMFTDKNYFQRKYEIQGAKNIKLLDCREDPNDFSVQFERQVPADVDIPAFARKLIPEMMTVVQRDSWSAGTKTGRLDVHLKGMPVDVVCDMVLEDTDSGCDLIMNWTLTSKLPMVGGKLEKLLWDDLRGKMASDTEAGEQILVNY